MDKYKKMGKNMFLFMFGNIGSKIILFLMVPIYTNIFNRQEFGQIDIFNQTISLLLPFITLQVYDSLFRFLMNKNKNENDLVTNSFVLIILSFLFSLLFLPILNQFILSRELVKYFYIILFLNLLYKLLSSFLRGKEIIKIFSVGEVLYTFLLASFNIIFLVLLKFNVKGYFYSIILSRLTTILFWIFYTKIWRYISFRKINYILQKEMIFYSIPLIPNALSWWVMNLSDRYILKYHLGTSAIGLYAISYKIPSIMMAIKSVFSNAWQISAIEEFESTNESEFYSKVFSFQFSIFILITSLLLIILKPFMSIYVSSDFFISWRFVPFLLIGTLFSTFSSFMGVGYIATRNTKGAFYTSFLGALTNLIINLIAIPRFGIQAASFSTMIAYFIMWILRTIKMKSILNIKLNFIKISLSIIIMFIQTYILFSPHLDDSIGIFFVIIIIFININNLNLFLTHLINIIKNRLIN